LISEPAHPRVVQIHRDSSAGPDFTIERPFFSRHAGQTIKPFEMSRCDGGNNAHIRISDLSEPLNLTWMIRSQLYHRYRIALTQPQQSQWQPYQVVKVAFCLEYLSPKRLAIEGSRFKNRRNHFFGRGLSVRAGNSQHLRCKLFAAMMGQIS
jgi:hypothetical protein